MTREQKIAAIYKEMADKELTFGCRINTGYGRKVSIVEQTADERGYIVVSPESLYGDDDIGAYYIGLRVNGLEAIEEIDIAEIIGHPVMIGDVLDWVSGRIFDATKGEEDFLIDDGVDDVVGYDYKLFSMRSKISSAVNIRWNYKRLPIEKQTDRCIDFIYSLIKK